MSDISVGSQAYTNGLRTLEDLAKEQTRQTKTSLGKNEFLQLLVAQMSNQDPMSPTSDTDFIAQLAQFSALEQMQELNVTMTANQAYSLVGKFLYAVKVVDGKEILTAGTVDGVVFESGVPYLIIGEGRFLVSEIVGLSDTSEQGTVVTSQAHLLGKNITAAIDEVQGEGDDAKVVTRYVSGVATEITLKDGIVYVTIEKADGTSEKAPVNSITRVGMTAEAADTEPTDEGGDTDITTTGGQAL